MDDKDITVLLVEDNEDDYILLRSVIEQINSPRFHVKWVNTYDAALDEMSDGHYDICLMDYRLGGRSGLSLLNEARQRVLKGPVIFLTGYGDPDVDIEAMKAGASDFLEKNEITPTLLERSIRYAMAHARTTSELQNLSRKILSAQEDERRYLAKELHDSIGSSLTAIKIVLERNIDALTKGKEASDEIRLENLVGLVQETIRETKRIQHALRPPIIDDLGIMVALHSFCREFNKFYPHIQIRQAFDIQEEEIPEALKIVIYRVCQEAFNNVAKHSSATSVCLTLKKQDNGIDLAIEDNGQGFSPQDLLAQRGETVGMGLSSMKERSEITGGTFSIQSSQNMGTTISVSWPHCNLIFS